MKTRTWQDIAGWFIEQEPMDHMKLASLVYLAYAWFLTLNGERLYKEAVFEALPVMIAEKNLFAKYHRYGKQKIKLLKSNVLELEIQDFLRSVYDTYAAADGEGLAAYLRQSAPYQKARQRKEDFLISEAEMIAYYEKQIHA